MGNAFLFLHLFLTFVLAIATPSPCPQPFHTMRHFNLSDYHSSALHERHNALQRPRIGLTGNFAEGETRLAKAYYHQVERAGAVPVIIPPSADASTIIATLHSVDALLLTGGADINPLWQGDGPSPRLHAINSERDLAELLTIRLAYDRGIPMLGICRGMQALAMALDGKVTQDIYEEERGEEILSSRGQEQTKPVSLLKHSQDGPRHEPTHTVQVLPDSILSAIYNGAQRLYVNSMHHQAVGDTGPQFRVVATAPDGIVEAMESSCHRPILAVQWHPECLDDDGLPLFRWLTEQAALYRKARTLHQHIITLDTHCDTPMFFADGADFRQRDPRIKVDLDKMLDGGLDAATMVAYLPQTMADNMHTAPTQQGESARQGNAPITPFAYANHQLDRIEHLVRHSEGRMALACTDTQLHINKQRGRKSIMCAIENGLALEGRVENVAHFAKRNIVYITLCHNGDNDLCDSAAGCGTHHGVSSLGAEVIKEMNRLGLMVDLSHAAETSFYDALEISATPIVCSHSNCRALCDHPRNLTDDQLRALARKGGVAHITLYPGFLAKAEEADIRHALQHLHHAVSIMGIQHVGLGTDFDGDGGIRGFNDASEAINFTMHLLRQRYNDSDIRRIWGSNWLHLMREIQQAGSYPGLQRSLPHSAR